MKKAIYIPTYNRPQAVNELFVRYGDVYKTYGYDIYIVDSSPDNDTYVMIKEYINGNNVFYKRVSADIHSNLKVYSIYKDFSEGEYDYIWVQSDSIRWNLSALERITEVINMNKYDIIVPNYRDVYKIGDYEYDEINDFFTYCAWHMTLYGGAILRKNVLSNADWGDLEKKYIVPDKINFSHVGMYFEQLAKMDKFLAFHIGLPDSSLASSLFKKESGWRKDTFFIHCECWPAVIKTLPAVYTSKERVIKDQGANCGDLTVRGLKKLRAEGVLNLQVFKKYCKNWKDVSDISVGKFLLYALIPQTISKMITDEAIKERKLRRKLVKFCSLYKKKYIYGCGVTGNQYADILDSLGIEFDGFLVSKGHPEKEFLRGKRVMMVSDEILADDNNCLIFALNELNYNQVMEEISRKPVKAGLMWEKL